MRNRSHYVKPLAGVLETDMDQRLLTSLSWVTIGHKGSAAFPVLVDNGMVSIGRVLCGSSLLNVRNTRLAPNCKEITPRDFRYFRGVAARDVKAIPDHGAWACSLLRTGDQL